MTVMTISHAIAIKIKTFRIDIEQRKYSGATNRVNDSFSAPTRAGEDKDSCRQRPRLRNSTIDILLQEDRPRPPSRSERLRPQRSESASCRASIVVRDRC